MLTKLTMRNFKRFSKAEVELGKSVVLIGPNNSGKTTVLQALTLWDIGVKRWIERRRGRPSPEKRPGVTINRRDLIAVPVPEANLLWRDLKVRNVAPQGDGTQNVRVEIVVEGISEGEPWVCGLEFDYANEESFYCRPLRAGGGKEPKRMPVPEAAGKVRIAYLPPMSGLAAQEQKRERGGINVLIGEGRTAEVLRNLCYQLMSSPDGQAPWKDLKGKVSRLFGVTLDEPQYVAERDEITMTYYRDWDRKKTRLDLSTAGRGLHQTLLLLAYLYANPGAVLLLDEPDAHLEILRQREIYELLTETAESMGGQVIAATHSEVLLQEAAERDVVIAFVGEPCRINDRGTQSQVLKALKQIGFHDYIQAQRQGWVLYLEGSTDLAILRAFAETLSHEALRRLERPFVHYVLNSPPAAESHFGGLCLVKPDLRGVAIFDHLDRQLQPASQLHMLMWARREIENYLCYPEVLMAYAEHDQPDDSFGRPDREHRKQVMWKCIEYCLPGYALEDRNDAWWRNRKVSDEFLDRVFERYFAELRLPNIMLKTNYHRLARLVPKELIDKEVREKLDAIVEVAKLARPVEDKDIT